MRCPTYLAGPPRDENDSGRCRLVGLLLAAAVFGASGVAWADAVCGGYDDCLQRMTQAAVSKDYAAAQAAAEAALALRQEPVLLLNLGTFHERQQHSAEALDYYQRYLKNPGPELTPERRSMEQIFIEITQHTLHQEGSHA